MAQGIQMQHSISYMYTKNGLAESLIKRIKLFVQPLLHNYNLPTTYWGHTILHATDLIQSLNSIIHVSDRVAVLNKIIQTPSLSKKGRTTTKMNNISSKHLRKERTRPPPKTVKENQPLV
jgi:hypothetical protein